MSPNLATLVLKKRYSSGTDKTGVSCQFFLITSKYGIKCYSSKESRDACWFTQKDSAMFNYAPEVGERFDIDLGEPIYCYVTEAAESIITPEMYELRKRGQFQDYNTLWRNLNDKMRPQIEELDDKMRDNVGWENEDCHIGNYGYVQRDGEKVLVCIDFGND